MIKCLWGVVMLICGSQATAADLIIYNHGFNKPGMYVPGFRTYSSDDYVPAEKNIVLLKELKQSLLPIRIAGFSSSDSEKTFLVCRASYPIYVPGKLPYEAFIAEAMKAELSEVGLYSLETGMDVTGRLDAIDFNSFGTGKWTIEATFSVAGKEPLKVRHEMTYRISPGAVAACGDVGHALVPAIQEFLYGLYADPKFKELLARQ